MDKAFLLRLVHGYKQALRPNIELSFSLNTTMKWKDFPRLLQGTPDNVSLFISASVVRREPTTANDADTAYLQHLIANEYPGFLVKQAETIMGTENESRQTYTFAGWTTLTNLRDWSHALSDGGLIQEENNVNVSLVVNGHVGGVVLNDLRKLETDIFKARHVTPSLILAVQSLDSRVRRELSVHKTYSHDGGTTVVLLQEWLDKLLATGQITHQSRVGPSMMVSVREDPGDLFPQHTALLELVGAALSESVLHKETEAAPDITDAAH